MSFDRPGLPHPGHKANEVEIDEVLAEEGIELTDRELDGLDRPGAVSEGPVPAAPAQRCQPGRHRAYRWKASRHRAYRWKASRRRAYRWRVSPRTAYRWVGWTSRSSRSTIRPTTIRPTTTRRAEFGRG
jgi:hypothetical protein